MWLRDHAFARPLGLVRGTDAPNRASPRIGRGRRSAGQPLAEAADAGEHGARAGHVRQRRLDVAGRRRPAILKDLRAHRAGLRNRVGRQARRPTAGACASEHPARIGATGQGGRAIAVGATGVTEESGAFPPGVGRLHGNGTYSTRRPRDQQPRDALDQRIAKALRPRGPGTDPIGRRLGWDAGRGSRRRLETVGRPHAAWQTCVAGIVQSAARNGLLAKVASAKRRQIAGAVR